MTESWSHDRRNVCKSHEIGLEWRLESKYEKGN